MKNQQANSAEMSNNIPGEMFQQEQQEVFFVKLSL